MSISLSINDINDERKLVSSVDSCLYSVRIQNEDIEKKERLVLIAQEELIKSRGNLERAIKSLDNNRESLLQFYVNKVGIKMPEKTLELTTPPLPVIERLDREVF